MFLSSLVVVLNVHIYVLTYVRTYLHTYIHTYVRTYIRTYMHAHICRPISIFAITTSTQYICLNPQLSSGGDSDIHIVYPLLRKVEMFIPAYRASKVELLTMTLIIRYVLYW